MNLDRRRGVGLFLLPFAVPLLSAVSALAQGPLQPPPAPPQNPVTPAKAVLGKILFWEEQLSSNNRVACGTCHQPGVGGGDLRRARHPGLDGRLNTPDDGFGSPGVIRSDRNDHYQPAVAFGFTTQVTGRASPSAITGGYFPELFWDGRAGGTFRDPQTGAVVIPQGGALESQSLAPILNDVEMAHEQRDWTAVSQKLQTARPMALATNLPADVAAAIAAHPSYPALFQAAFGDATIDARRIAFALATYERTLVPDQTPWDQLQRGVPGALTPNQMQGMILFNGPARCNLCHQPGLFSDRTYRNLGLRPIAEDNGRQAVTGNPADRGRFKVPSLRNVGLRTSFMHNGQFTDLPAVIGFYVAGGGPNRDNKDPALLPLNLPPQQGQQVVDFIANALTDPRVRNRQYPFDKPTLFSERNPPLGTLVGAGSPGTGGAVPQILAEVPANTGNADFKIGVHNGRGDAFATLAVALRAAAPGTVIHGVPIHVDLGGAALLGAQLTGLAGQAGQGHTTFQHGIPADPGLVGITLHTQWFVWDPATAAGAATSSGARFALF